MSFPYSVRVFPLSSPGGKMVAFASLIIDESIEVKNFKIFNGSKGLFVSNPSHQDKKDADKWYPDVWFSEEKEEGEFKGPLETEIHEAMLEAYEALSSGARKPSGASNPGKGSKPRKPVEDDETGPFDNEGNAPAPKKRDAKFQREGW